MNRTVRRHFASAGSRARPRQDFVTGVSVPYADPQAQRDYQREWAKRRRAEWIEGKSCVHCGSRERLEVHHVDPTAKTTHRLWTWSPGRRDAELAKCEVLCDPCHDRLHADRRRMPCGTNSRYRKGCRCSACREAHRIAGLAWRAAKVSRERAPDFDPGDVCSCGCQNSESPAAPEVGTTGEVAE